jgi:hypothetical protein
MPVVSVETIVAELHDDDASIVRAAFTGRGRSDGLQRLRASKPFSRVKTFEQGCANYVWRMLCFDLCDFAPHYCIPITADIEVDMGYDARDGRPDRADREGRDKRRQDVRNMMKALDMLVAAVEAEMKDVPMKGVMRWGRAYGMV